MAVKIDVDDKATLINIAKTCIQKLVSDDSPALSQIVVNATKQVAEKTEDGALNVDLDNIKVEKKAGGRYMILN